MIKAGDKRLKEQQAVEGFISYGAGAGTIALSLTELATVAQQVGIILGCIVVALRLIHDAVMLYRKLKEK